MITTTESVGTLSDAFFARLIDFFNYSKQSGREISALWNALSTVYQKGLVDALNTGDPSTVRRFMGSLYNTEAIHGMDENNPAYVSDPETYDRIWHHHLELVAIGLGVLPPWDDYLHQRPKPVFNSEVVYHDICQALGFRLGAPRIGCRHGIEINGDLVPLKTWMFAWAYKTVRMLVHLPDTNTLEIGGGLGGFAQLMLKSKVARHFVVDIPLTSIMAGFHLAAEFGEDAVCFDGEERMVKGPAAYFILPEHVENLHATDFTLAFNMDSFPEIPQSQLDHYINLIDCTLKTLGFFVSINHEGGFDGKDTSGGGCLVRDEMKTTTLTQYVRTIFPLRAGYMEEVWCNL